MKKKAHDLFSLEFENKKRKEKKQIISEENKL